MYIHRGMYVIAESLSNCLHAWLFMVLNSEARALVSGPYLRYIKLTECQTERTTDAHEACRIDRCHLN